MLLAWKSEEIYRGPFRGWACNEPSVVSSPLQGSKAVHIRYYPLGEPLKGLLLKLQVKYANQVQGSKAVHIRYWPLGESLGSMHQFILWPGCEQIYLVSRVCYWSCKFWRDIMLTTVTSMVTNVTQVSRRCRSTAPPTSNLPPSGGPDCLSKVQFACPAILYLKN